MSPTNTRTNFDMSVWFCLEKHTHAVAVFCVLVCVCDGAGVDAALISYRDYVGTPLSVCECVYKC